MIVSQAVLGSMPNNSANNTLYQPWINDFDGLESILTHRHVTYDRQYCGISAVQSENTSIAISTASMYYLYLQEEDSKYWEKRCGIYMRGNSMPIWTLEIMT